MLKLTAFSTASWLSPASLKYLSKAPRNKCLFKDIECAWNLNSGKKKFFSLLEQNWFLWEKGETCCFSKKDSISKQTFSICVISSGSVSAHVSSSWCQKQGIVHREKQLWYLTLKSRCLRLWCGSNMGFFHDHHFVLILRWPPAMYRWYPPGLWVPADALWLLT